MTKLEIFQISLPVYSVDKALMFRKYRKKIGYSAYECSFLIGKHDFFIRDIESLLEKSWFSTVDTNYVLLIFEDELENIFPTIAHNNNYSVLVTKSVGLKRKLLFQVEIEVLGISDSKQKYSIQEEEKHLELPTNLELEDEQTLRDFIFSLYSEGFFNNTKTALEIFNVCRKQDNFGKNFHARNMIRALDYYTNKKSGNAILDNSRTNLFSRRLFVKPFDFEISESKGSISTAIKSLNLNTFKDVTKWVSYLDYRRNTDKDNVLCLFDELCGTCSTKHALLKRLADENGNTELKLMLGIFTMNAKNTPAIKRLLKKYKLDYIPEAHNYLRAYNYILDYTGIGINETKFELDILEEIEIQPDQITDYKVSYHRDYLDSWIKENEIPYSLDEFWKIREECIKALTLSRLELHTERLSLRPFRKEDGAAMYELNDDPEVLQYTGDTQFADTAATESFLENYSQYEEYGVGRMIVILKATDEILGWCGLKYHPEEDEYDIGYRFYKRHWGKGYATESAKAIMADGFARIGMKQIVGRARVENTASINVFDKLGMEFVKNYVEDGDDWVLYQIKK